MIAWGKIFTPKAELFWVWWICTVQSMRHHNKKAGKAELFFFGGILLMNEPY